MSTTHICPPDHKHGQTNNCYTSHACRCPDCKAGSARIARERRKLIAYGRYVPPTYATTERFIAHVSWLQSYGHTYDWVAGRGNTSSRTVYMIMTGRRARVGVDIEARVLALRPDFASLNPGHIIPSTGTKRRIQALVARGWSQSELSRRLGIHQDNVAKYLQSPGTFVSTHRRIVALYDELWDVEPPRETKEQRCAASLSIRRARENGWVGPLAWDDDTIDDPNATPDLGQAESILERHDESAITDAIDGLPATLSPSERRAVITVLHARRWSAERIAVYAGCDKRTVDRIRTELGLPTFTPDQVKDAA